MNHVMIDLETLGTTADAVIMSIGAVKFDPHSSDLDDDVGFYASISVESNLEKRRRIDEDTLIWWLGQEPAAQAVFREPKQTLGNALESLSDWVGPSPDDIFIWSNGADFDIPMLAHAFRSFDWIPPWYKYGARCFRTMKNLPAAKRVPKAPNAAKHNAFSDAVAQARTLQAIYAQLAKEKVS